MSLFSETQIKSICSKCKVLLRKLEELRIKASVALIKSSASGKLLPINFDEKLKFNKHAKVNYQKSQRRLNVLVRNTPYMQFREN